ncbi:RDD family protein [Gordonia sp. CPCC 206044]|uniref:RDD family protein n=1 Tax=Gordonia sp. CPCC 206044 TaxID=3140793 RepID=UPI003AF3A396
MGRATGSWLSGPQIGPGGGGDVEFRGQDLGLPGSGPGSLAGGWPRTLGLLVDWVLAAGISLLFVRFGSPNLGTVVLGVWFVIGAVAVTLFGFTPGQFVVGLRVARVDHGPDRAAAEAGGKADPAAVGIVRALARQVLIVFLVPALMNDYNGRALHDRATGTAMVRTR